MTCLWIAQPFSRSSSLEAISYSGLIDLDACDLSGEPTEKLTPARGPGAIEAEIQTGLARLRQAEACPRTSVQIRVGFRPWKSAYKGQPVIEKRFAQLKTDFAVAPVFL